eukprot:TRINITY_DN38887_c0_g1_i3.p1 TRINITY_DN38887_c0_g1~~TRINITY_DN38887_c0_g1_i3.p1  ORF type:complete len:246 (+),score=46.98 TRINITY_DN38887_c0_g1_i3:49-786(+)
MAVPLSLPPLEAGWKRLYLLRHGRTEMNASNVVQGRALDPPLDEVGRQQAVAAAAALSTVGRVDIVGSSSLRRSAETADAIAEAVDAVRRSQGEPWSEARRVRLQDLDELDCGTLDGKAIKEVASEIKEISAAWRSGETSRKVGGGESPDDLLRRAWHGLLSPELLGSDADTQVIVLVAHTRVNKVLLCCAQGLPLTKMDEVPQDNGAVNVLDYDSATERFRVVLINFVAHLGEDANAATFQPKL